MKNFIITSLLTIALVGAVVTAWHWNSARPTNEAGIRAMLDDWTHLKEQAEKYPLEDGK